jgi:hypothetical protein
MSIAPRWGRVLVSLVELLEKRRKALGKRLLLQLLIVELQPAADHFMHGGAQPGQGLPLVSPPLATARGHLEISGTIHHLSGQGYGA